METAGRSEPHQRILTAAKEVFAARGYRGGSLNEVAKRSGFTRPGLLHYYPSKEALLLGLLDARDERLRVDALETDPEEGIRELLDRLPAAVITPDRFEGLTPQPPRRSQLSSRWFRGHRHAATR